MITLRKILSASFLIAALGVGSATLIPPSILSRTQAQTTAPKVAPNRPITIVVANNTGIPLMASLSGAKPSMLGAGRSTQFASKPITGWTNSLSISVFDQGGQLLVFKPAGYNPTTNVMTVSVQKASKNSPQAHLTINVAPNGTVSFI